MTNSRRVALNILNNIENNASYINIELDSVLSKSDLTPVDKRFVTEIVHGVIKWKINLDYIIFSYSKVKRNKINPKVLLILRMGVYQIMYMDKVPDSAAVNESVKLATKISNPAIKGFVNAILRNVIRNRDNISYPEDKREYISARYSYPDWMVEYLCDLVGEEKCESIIKSQCERPNVYLRCNTYKITANELVQRLGQSIDAKIYHNDLFPTLDYCICAEKLFGISGMKEFEEGLFYVQDVSSAMVTEVMNPSEGSIVIDVCAAPGGKSTHIAEKMLNTGKVIAMDKYEHKISLIRENAQRLGLTNVQAVCHDSSEIVEEYMDMADCVLVDAPCSGLGIISRKPDIKYSIDRDGIESLRKISYEILDKSSLYVKRGGILVYSLCTITKEESVDNVEKFLKEHDDFELVKIDCINQENDGYITFYPDSHGSDGFFVCKMRRKDM